MARGNHIGRDKLWMGSQCSLQGSDDSFWEDVAIDLSFEIRSGSFVKWIMEAGLSGEQGTLENMGLLIEKATIFVTLYFRKSSVRR